MRRDIAHDCPRIEALSLLVDDEISGGARDEIVAHAGVCPLCRVTLEGFRDLRSALGALPDEGPGVDIAALIGDRLAPRSLPGSARRSIRWRWELAPTGLAAAGVLAMGAYLGVLLVGGTAITTRAPAVTVFSALPPGGVCLTPACYGAER